MRRRRAARLRRRASTTVAVKCRGSSPIAAGNLVARAADALRKEWPQSAEAWDGSCMHDFTTRQCRAQGERTRSSANLSRRRAAKETLAARLVSGYTIGAFIHVLLVIAPVSLLVQFVSGRRVV